MRYVLRGILATLGIFGSAHLLAEIDKSKQAEKEGQPEPEMGGPGGKGKEFTSSDHEKYHRKLAEESQANLKKISELMDKVRGRLAQKQTGDATQGDQREVVKELQDLIDKVGKCQACGSSGQGQSQSKEQKEQQGKKKQTGSEKQREENERQELAKQREQKGEKGKDPKDNGKVQNDQRRLAKLPPQNPNATPAEQAEILQRWGLLPKKVVEQMRNSSGKEYPAEYREIISRYYRKLYDLYEEKGGER
jgi:hypothetical protein